MVRLILMRIRYRASDYAQIDFVKQKHISFEQKNETRFLCEIGPGDDARVIYLFARVIQQLGRWAQKKSSHRPYPALDTFKISCLDPASTRPVRF